VNDPDVRPLFGRPLHPWELVALDGLAGSFYTVVLLATAIARAVAVPHWVSLVFVAGIGLPLVARRRWPGAVFGVVLTVSTLGVLLGVTREPLLAAAYALYPVALTGPRRRWEPSVAIAAVSAAGLVAAVLTGPGPGIVGAVELLAMGWAVLGGAWTVGRAVRERRALAAREAAERADRAAAEERLRIARELHDVVSHTLSLIGVKAGIANHVADQRPDEARAALSAIETMSRDALTEMRHMLGVLRDDADPASGQRTGFAPVPGLAALPELVDRAAQAGVGVEVDVRGVEGLPPGVELSIYRIVQEAVTNVVRHAAPTTCRVLVEGGPAEVRIGVTDDGPGHGTPPGRPGHGLVGMRERAAMHGGTVTAGPRPDGGFAVSVRLPREAT
jgi:signal transduction histidine kinase